MESNLYISGSKPVSTWSSRVQPAKLHDPSESHKWWSSHGRVPRAKAAGWLNAFRFHSVVDWFDLTASVHRLKSKPSSASASAGTSVSDSEYQ
ncbi:hypothetical protein BHM03_00041258 [Ensete ventricosum]|nr:hypothetical protein BHM03_00041258 [Ensete ventricosum]